MNCSFCGKDRIGVFMLISAGKTGACICSDCVLLCNEMVVVASANKIKRLEKDLETFRTFKGNGSEFKHMWE